MQGTVDDDQGGVSTPKADEELGFKGGDQPDDRAKTVQDRPKQCGSKREHGLGLDDVLNKWIATKRDPITAETHGDSQRLFVRCMSDIGITTISVVNHTAMRGFRSYCEILGTVKPLVPPQPR